jgi:hypothetical protein
MTAKKQLTEPQAWREIARRIAEGEWEREGICVEIALLLGGGCVSRCVHDAMWSRCIRHRQALDPSGWGGTFIWPEGKNANERVLAALFLALEAEDDEQ